jgi:para-nitrobenzyl esterase
VPLNRPALDDAELERQVRAQLPRSAAERVAQAITVYRDSRIARGLPSTNGDIADAVATASRFRIPAVRLCEAHSVQQPRTFLYQCDWESPARRGALGACHGVEIPFVFGTLAAADNARFCGKGPEAEQLSEHMMDAWLAFAKNGEPGHPGIGEWPAYDTTARSTMIFGRKSGVERAPFEEERALWDTLLGPRGSSAEV